MRPATKVERPVMDTSNRLSSLSIVVDDFDSSSQESKKRESKPLQPTANLPFIFNPYTRETLDAATKSILEEVEMRKHEFCKLIDEHNAVIEHLKQIEEESSSVTCKMTQRSIMT